MWAYSTSVCGDCGGDEEEIESDGELEGKGLAEADGGNRDPAGHERMEDSLEGKWGADGSQDVGGYVRRNLGPGEVADGDRLRWAWPIDRIMILTAALSKLPLSVSEF